MDTLDFIAQKYNLNLVQRSPITIPNFGRNDLASLFTELGFTKGVEIGVLIGNYSKILCEANPNLTLYSIDPWKSYEEYKDLTPQKAFDECYEHSKALLAPFKNCQLIRKKSMDAIPDFNDESLDFVYIDGNHEFASETNDIFEWSKKIKIGGIIAGHDYRKYKERSFSHSYEVVNAYTNAYRIFTWFITDHSKDRVRSWFWVKSR
jgi:hypothetical protein